MSIDQNAEVPSTPHSRGRSTVVITSLAVGFAAYAAALWLNWPAIASAYPTGDEFSLIAQSSAPALAWLTSGYSRYFVVYPEYWEPFTNFIRPVTNLTYAAFSCAGCFRWQLAIVNVGVLAASTGGLYLISRRLGNSQVTSGVLAACAFLAPAYWGTEMATGPAWAFDGVAALQSLAAVWLASRGQWFAALAVMAVAVLTKEAALPVVAALALYALPDRRLRIVSLIAVAILVAWAVLRLSAFGSSVGIYVFDAPLSWHRLLAHGSAALWLPVAYSSFIPFRAMLQGVLDDWPMLIVIVANVAALVTGARAAAGGLGGAAPVEGRENRRLLLPLSVLCVCASGLFYVVIGGGARLSYVFYLMFLLMLTAAAPGAWRSVSTGLVASAALVSALVFASDAEGQRPLDAFQKAGARQLMAALRLHSSPRPIYVANDFVSGYSAMSNVARVAGATGTVERGSSADLYGCALAELRAIRTTVTVLPAGELSLTTVLPPCAVFHFEGISTAKLLRHLDGSHLSRNPAIAYEFPQIEVESPSRPSEERTVRFGPVMTLTVRSSALLFYDFEKGDWVFVDSR